MIVFIASVKEETDCFMQLLQRCIIMILPLNVILSQSHQLYNYIFSFLSELFNCDPSPDNRITCTRQTYQRPCWHCSRVRVPEERNGGDVRRSSRRRVTIAASRFLTRAGGLFLLSRRLARLRVRDIKRRFPVPGRPRLRHSIRARRSARCRVERAELLSRKREARAEAAIERQFPIRANRAPGCTFRLLTDKPR